MSREYSAEMEESGGGDGFRGLFKNLGREEILEVLGDDEGFCGHCEALLQSRVRRLINKKLSGRSESSDNSQSSTEFWSTYSTSRSSTQTPNSFHTGTLNGLASSPPESVNSKQKQYNNSAGEIARNGGPGPVPSLSNNGLSEEQERVRFAQIGRKKDYVHIERIAGKPTNVLKGLELHTGVFTAEEQKEIVDCVYRFQRIGHNGQLKARTYTAPKKWMRGKGRVTIQFGCCYNYAVDKNGNPPGIIRDEEVDPLPLLFKQMIKRMVRWHVLPPTCIPNSCIVNMYDAGDCIPPHIDHHDFLRPFCTVSFLAECNILFGANLKVIGPGEFAGPVYLPLPVGSVLILSGNGADVAKHCVPGVPAKRISITFRKMDDSKLPYRYASEPELTEIKPLVYSPITKLPVQQKQPENKKVDSKLPYRYASEPELTEIKPLVYSPITKLPVQQKQPENKKVAHQEPVAVAMEASNNNSIFSEKDDFPPLGSLSVGNKPRANRNGWRQ